jgi:hypothetical protein
LKSIGDDSEDEENDFGSGPIDAKTPQGYLATLRRWLKGLAIFGMPRLPAGSEGLPPDGVKLVEAEANTFQNNCRK